MPTKFDAIGIAALKAVPAPGMAMFSAVVAAGATIGAATSTAFLARLPRLKPNSASALIYAMEPFLRAWASYAAIATSMTSAIFLIFFIFN